MSDETADDMLDDEKNDGNETGKVEKAGEDETGEVGEADEDDAVDDGDENEVADDVETGEDEAGEVGGAEKDDAVDDGDENEAADDVEAEETEEAAEVEEADAESPAAGGPAGNAAAEAASDDAPAPAAANRGGRLRNASWTALARQIVRKNLVLALVVLAVMVLCCCMVNVPTETEEADEVVSEEVSYWTTSTQTSEAAGDLYPYLFGMAAYNEVAGTELSLRDFATTTNYFPYEQMFATMNMQFGLSLSSSGLEEALAQLERSGESVDDVERQFEYAYALDQANPVFNGEALTIDDLIALMSGTPRVSSEPDAEQEVAAGASALDEGYFKLMTIAPLFLLVLVMALRRRYPMPADEDPAHSDRRALACAQTICLVAIPLVIVAIVCCLHVILSLALGEDAHAGRIVVLYVGAYLLTEAMAGLSYLGSCLFARLKNALAFGGGLAMWFLFAALVGFFGSQAMVDAGLGSEVLGIFNYLTITSLIDVNAISTIGGDAVDFAFIWKFVVLAVVAAACYVAGTLLVRRCGLQGADAAAPQEDE